MTASDALKMKCKKLRNDFDTVEPSIRRLSSIEQELSDLMQQIRASMGKGSNASGFPVSQSAAPVMNKSGGGGNADWANAKPAPLAPQRQTASQIPPQKQFMQEQRKSGVNKNNFRPPAAAGNGTLRAIRTSDNPGKTRIVIETSQQFKPAVSVNGNNMSVTYPAGTPAMDVSGINIRSKKVASVSKTDNGDGSFTLNFALKSGSSFLTQGYIKPNNVSRNYRHFIDISR